MRLGLNASTSTTPTDSNTNLFPTSQHPKLDSSSAGACTRADRAGLRESILKKAFDVYDTDGSGTIDHDELRKLFQDLGWPVHDEFLQRAVRVLDEDMSGGIDFPEFLKWTEFAYASRVLYRSEMMPTTPRRAAILSSFVDIDEKADGQPVKRLMSLGVVHEHRETGSGIRDSDDDDDGEGEKEQSKANTGSSQDDEGAEEVRHWSGQLTADNELVTKFSACDMKLNASEPTSELVSTPRSSCFLPGLDLCGGIKRRQRRSPGRVWFQGEQVHHIASRDSSCLDEELGLSQNATADASWDDDKQDSAQQETEALTQEVGEICLRRKGSEKSADMSEWMDCGDEDSDGTEFGLPIKRMATMVLGRLKLGGLLTSTARSQSMMNLRGRGMARRLMTRTESKMTVRMRWACGQFQDDSGDAEEGDSGSSEEAEGELKSRPEWPDREKKEWTEAGSGGEDEWEGDELGRMVRPKSEVEMIGTANEDLRRVRSE